MSQSVLYFSYDKKKRPEKGLVVHFMNRLTEKLNQDLTKLNLPVLAGTKTKTFVRMNTELQTMSEAELVGVVRDYGLLIPILFLADISVDYAKFITGDTDIDMRGFIRYVDTQLLIATDFDLRRMDMYFRCIPSFDPRGQDVDTLRQEYVKFILEYCINNRYKSPTENILDLEQMLHV